MKARDRAFEFVGARLEGHTLSLSYRLIREDGTALDLIERLTLPLSLPAPDPSDPAVQDLLRACLLTFGVSYYKATLPKKMIGLALHPDEFDFWNTLYSEGLGEFYFRNSLDIPDQVGFELASSALLRSSSPGPRPEKVLVLMGGGKDSAVVADLVRRMQIPAEALALGDSAWIQRSTGAARLALHTISRRIDPELLELNAQGAYNGHVPISACIAVIATLVGYSAGFSDILVGNERGADDANTVHQGRPINHQWSKSSRFERLFQAWQARFVPEAPRYSSLLRPLSEIRIAGIFAQLRPQHSEFTSCNRNFRQHLGDRPERWCGECAKCVFVSLLLAPHLDEEARQTIFGGRQFWLEPHNLPSLLELLGLREVKPWDCVGTPEECWLSLFRYRDQHPLPPAIEALISQAPPALKNDRAKHWREEWSVRDAPTLSTNWNHRLHALLDTD